MAREPRVHCNRLLFTCCRHESAPAGEVWRACQAQLLTLAFQAHDPAAVHVLSIMWSDLIR